jgi:hypothetical protein
VERSKSTWKAKVFLTLLWLNFAGLWARVLSDTTVQDASISLEYVGKLMGVYTLLIALWIFHNIRIFKNKGPRQSVRVVPYVITVDTLQRSISRHGNLTGQEITVDVVGGQKVFRDHTVTTPRREPVLTY